jgi:hypothetical protein
VVNVIRCQNLRLPSYSNPLTHNPSFGTSRVSRFLRYAQPLRLPSALLKGPCGGGPARPSWHSPSDRVEGRRTAIPISLRRWDICDPARKVTGLGRIRPQGLECEPSYAFQMVFQFCSDFFRQHHDPILVAFSLTNCDLLRPEVDVLNASRRHSRCRSCPRGLSLPEGATAKQPSAVH